MAQTRWKKVNYRELNGRQQERFNFQKLSAVLADYGFNCIWLSADWKDADFLADNPFTGETLRVQLKTALTVNKKYVGKNLWMGFPIGQDWYLIRHRDLVKIIDAHTPALGNKSWAGDKDCFWTNPKAALVEAVEPYRFSLR